MSYVDLSDDLFYIFCKHVAGVIFVHIELIVVNSCYISRN